MENTFFLKTEVIFLLVSFLYMLYYIWYHLKQFFSHTWRRVKNKKPVSRMDKDPDLLLVEEKKEKEIIKQIEEEEKKKNQISSENKIAITDILRREATLYGRGDYEKAKNLIIEWLALDKHHKHLNLELANIYNKEQEYKKSEYIYRELIENQRDDFDLLKKLGFVLALQWKYKDSIRVYKEAYDKKANDPAVVDILSDLTYETGDYEWTVMFTTKFLKEKPRDTEKLLLQASAYKKLKKRKKALASYRKILELKPYNEKILKKVAALEKKIEEKAWGEKKKKKKKKN